MLSYTFSHTAPHVRPPHYLLSRTRCSHSTVLLAADRGSGGQLQIFWALALDDSTADFGPPERTGPNFSKLPFYCTPPSHFSRSLFFTFARTFFPFRSRDRGSGLARPFAAGFVRYYLLLRYIMIEKLVSLHSIFPPERWSRSKSFFAKSNPSQPTPTQHGRTGLLGRAARGGRAASHGHWTHSVASGHK